jgi:ABC transport system ATP-binding/permease protein
MNAGRKYRIDARAIGVERGGKEIIGGISVSLESGELVALLGPSGSGKSTLLKALIGFQRATRGRVDICGRNLYETFDELKTLIGYVPQDDILHTSLSVEKTLDYAAQLRLPDATTEMRDAAINGVLRQIDLADRRGVKVKSLSGGQRKRVSLGVELIAKPPLLFLDEPTSGLDPALEEKMMQLFRTLTQPDRLTVVTTHVMASLELVDLALIVAKGRLVFVGPPKEAPAFFGTADLPSVYRTLASSDARTWSNKLEATSLYRTYVTQRLSSPAPPMPARAEVGNSRSFTPRSA